MWGSRSESAGIAGESPFFALLFGAPLPSPLLRFRGGIGDLAKPHLNEPGTQI